MERAEDMKEKGEKKERERKGEEVAWEKSRGKKRMTEDVAIVVRKRRRDGGSDKRQPAARRGSSGRRRARQRQRKISLRPTCPGTCYNLRDAGEEELACVSAVREGGGRTTSKKFPQLSELACPFPH